jgi:hypothetical protein
VYTLIFFSTVSDSFQWKYPVSFSETFYPPSYFWNKIITLFLILPFKGDIMGMYKFQTRNNKEVYFMSNNVSKEKMEEYRQI